MLTYDDAGVGPQRTYRLVSRDARTGKLTRSEPVPDGLMAVAPSGQISYLFTNAQYDGSSITDRLYYREARTVSSLSPPRLIAEMRGIVPPPPGARAVGIRPSMAVGAGGHVVVAWREGAYSDSPALVTQRAPGEDWATPQRVFAGTGTGGGASVVRAALNRRGDAVVTWAQPGPDSVGAAFSPSGGRFGPAQHFPHSGAEDPTVAVDPHGKATVLIREDPSTWIADLTRSGPFSRPIRLPGRAGALVASPHGAQVALTSDAGGPELQPRLGAGVRVALRVPGGAFGAPRPLGVAAGDGVSAAVDARGNVSAVALRGDGTNRLVRLTRFDRAPSGFLRVPTLVDGSSATTVVSNAAGHTALVNFVPPDGMGQSPATGATFIRERFADRRAAGLVAGTPTRRGGTVAVPVRCSESCLVRAELDFTTGKRRVRASRAVTLRGRASGRLSIRVGREERSRLRRLARRGRSTRMVLRVRAEDAWGNVRVVRRPIRARRLLR